MWPFLDVCCVAQGHLMHVKLKKIVTYGETNILTYHIKKKRKKTKENNQLYKQKLLWWIMQVLVLVLAIFRPPIGYNNSFACSKFFFKKNHIINNTCNYSYYSFLCNQKKTCNC